MSVRRLLKLLIVTSCLVSTGVTAEPPPIVRIAEGEGIVYLLPFIALWRSHQPEELSPRQFYTLAISRFVGLPISSPTGDTAIETLVNSVTTMGIDRTKRVLYGEGETPQSGLFKDNKCFFVITSDRVSYFGERVGWRAFLREHCGVTEPKSKNVEALFKKLVSGTKPLSKASTGEH